MQINEVKFSKFLYEDDVYRIFTKNYAQSITLWYEFQRVWYHRAVTTFNDVDKFFILIYFFKKTFNSYNEHFVNKSFDEFYSQENLEIEKFNIVDLARELKFSKETVRRKLIELEKSKIIIKQKKNVIINFRSFLTRADAEVKGFAKLISLFTKILYQKNLVERVFSEPEIETVIKRAFTFLTFDESAIKNIFELMKRGLLYESHLCWLGTIVTSSICLDQKSSIFLGFCVGSTATPDTLVVVWLFG